MERPTKAISTRLYPEGISCPIGVKVGTNWGNMSGVKI